MQKVNLDEHPNKSEWTIKHDPDTQLFTLVAENGRVLRGTYTTRRFAEVALDTYLTKIERKAQSQMDKIKKRGNVKV